MLTITANIPARKSAKFSDGRVVTYPACIKTFEQDEAGQWMYDGNKLRESDVIDMCRNASNWADLRRNHFQMVGFGS